MRKIISIALSFIVLVNCIPAFSKDGVNIIKDGYKPADYTYSADFINSLEKMNNPDISHEDYLHYKSFEGIHPRMFVDAKKVEYIKANSNEGGSYYHMYNRAVSRADYAMLAKLPGWPEGGKNTTNIHRDVGEKIAALAVGYLLTGNEKYYNGAQKGFYDIYKKRCEYRIYTADEIENNFVHIN